MRPLIGRRPRDCPNFPAPLLGSAILATAEANCSANVRHYLLIDWVVPSVSTAAAEDVAVDPFDESGRYRWPELDVRPSAQVPKRLSTEARFPSSRPVVGLGCRLSHFVCHGTTAIRGCTELAAGFQTDEDWHCKMQLGRLCIKLLGNGAVTLKRSTDWMSPIQSLKHR